MTEIINLHSVIFTLGCNFNARLNFKEHYCMVGSKFLWWGWWWWWMGRLAETEADTKKHHAYKKKAVLHSLELSVDLILRFFVVTIIIKIWRMVVWDLRFFIYMSTQQTLHVQGKQCKQQSMVLNLFNPFSSDLLFLYPLKTSENPQYRSETLVEYGLS